MKKMKTKRDNEQKIKVTVDIVILTLKDEDLKVLLVKRKNEPFKDYWALPGGFVENEEPLEETAQRELAEETSVKDIYLEQLYTFGEPKRDPRQRVVTVAYYALVRSKDLKPHADSDAAEVGWFSLSSLPELAFDHKLIIGTAQSRLRGKLVFSNVAMELLEPEFSLTELQQLYEKILGDRLDKRNFRKKIMALGIIDETTKVRSEKRGRPAKLFKPSGGTASFLRF
jgi:8-oxo-dGTP diphosphatase